MKKIMIFLVAIISVLTLINCKEKDNEQNILPEATQTGAKTGGAIVNGKIWIASNKYINPIGGVGTYCELYDQTAIINIDLRSVEVNSRIFLKTEIPNFELIKSYFLTENVDSKVYIYAIYSDNQKGFSTQPNSEYVGELKISRLDIKTQIVSGTFSFKAFDLYKNNGSIEVKDGRFDRKFD